MDDAHDPRVFLASERTLLAWIRTGIAVIGLGFVVAKFGLFLEAAGMGGASATAHLRSTAIGVALVLLGGGSLALAAIQHRRLCRSLGPHELPRDYSIRLAVLFALILSAASVLLATHVLLRAAEHDVPQRGRQPTASEPQQGVE